MTDDTVLDPSTGSGIEAAGSGIEAAGSGIGSTGSGIEAAGSGIVEETPLTERIEAILLIIDEPLGLVALAAAVSAPVPAVRQSLERLVDEYDGNGDGPRRGFELREVGGGWRLYVR
jgi:segregation and condensation protein B